MALGFITGRIASGAGCAVVNSPRMWLSSGAEAEGISDAATRRPTDWQIVSCPIQFLEAVNVGPAILPASPLSGGFGARSKKACLKAQAGDPRHRRPLGGKMGWRTSWHNSLQSASPAVDCWNEAVSALAASVWRNFWA